MEGKADPIRDLDIINEESRPKNAEFFEKVVNDGERKYVRGGDKKSKVLWEIRKQAGRAPQV